MAVQQERAPAQPAHHAARPAPLRLQGPDPRAILYPDSATDAFEKMFERDKEELRSLGVPIEVGSIDALFDDEPGYRIRPDEFALPDIALSRRRGGRDRPGDPGVGARAAGRGDHGRGAQAQRARASTWTSRALDIVQPRLSADEPAFDVVLGRHADGRRSSSATGARATPSRRPGTSSPGASSATPAAGTSWASTPTAARSGSSASRASRARPAGSARPAPTRSRRAPTSGDDRRLAAAAAARAGVVLLVRKGAGPRCAARRVGRGRASHGPDDRTGWDRLVLSRGGWAVDEVLGYGPDVFVEQPGRRPRRARGAPL